MSPLRRLRQIRRALAIVIQIPPRFRLYTHGQVQELLLAVDSKLAQLEVDLVEIMGEDEEAFDGPT